MAARKDQVEKDDVGKKNLKGDKWTLWEEDESRCKWEEKVVLEGSCSTTGRESAREYFEYYNVGAEEQFALYIYFWWCGKGGYWGEGEPNRGKIMMSGGELVMDLVTQLETV